MEIVKNELPEFLIIVKDTIKKLEIRQKMSVNKEMGYKGLLYARLADIKKGCGEFDKRAIKKALGTLNSKFWHVNVEKQLQKMSEELLHTNFEEIERIADEITNSGETVRSQ